MQHYWCMELDMTTILLILLAAALGWMLRGINSKHENYEMEFGWAENTGPSRFDRWLLNLPR